MMVDCGRGATQRALSARLDLTSVAAVLITHHHSDHVSDLATLAITRWTAGATTPLTVVAPAGPSADYARRCLDAFGDQAFHGQASAASGLRPSIETVAFHAGHDVAEAFAIDGWVVSSCLVDHHPIQPAVGYRIDRRSVRIAVSGDTAVCDGIRLLADGAHVLVHEALLTRRESAALLEWNAGARSVGELAASTLPATLVLTHMIPAPTSAEDEAAYVEEVRKGGFSGPTLVAHDLLRLSIEG